MSSMKAHGTFEITMSAEPPYDVEGGVTLSRVSFEKVFSGGFAGTSKVHMLAARTPEEGSAGYVALERLTGALDGRRGGFVVMHLGVMDAGKTSLTLSIVPGSGTEELRGIAGRMTIEVVEGKHQYAVEYTL
ncbi:MAG TPA: DUF3224 domain-containing protein [Kofleriaceae bacterium]|nr:DUF3224 domain-containing protein [Kofleriaceae bacterium]